MQRYVDDRAATQLGALDGRRVKSWLPAAGSAPVSEPTRASAGEKGATTLLTQTKPANDMLHMIRPGPLWCGVPPAHSKCRSDAVVAGGLALGQMGSSRQVGRVQEDDAEHDGTEGREQHDAAS